VSRSSKAAVLAMLLSAATGISLVAPAALAAPVHVRRITVKGAHLDWAPPRTAARAATLRRPAAVAGTITTFSKNVRDGTSTFRITMVGKNPFVQQANPSTTIRTTLIPVVVNFPNGDTWDPRVQDSCDTKSALTRAQQSPLFVPQDWTFGPRLVATGQYVDAFRRGEFYKQTKPTGINPGYHVKLALRTHAPLVLNVPLAYAAESTAECGSGWLGAVDINYLDSQLQSYITNTLGPTAAGTFPLFMLYNVIEYAFLPGGCCIGGYHGVTGNAGNLQTYAVATYDNSGDLAGSADTVIMSHEIAEWMDDPFTNNPTKPWGNIGQVRGCQNNLEVADPLTGTAISAPLATKTYHLQELAFFSWFYHSKPSLGVNQWFSSNGTFKTSAAPCP
jgi:hypothetical protein